MDRGVVLILDEIAERVPDGRRLEKARGDLIQERLEGVVVVPVHEHDVDGCLLQLARSPDTGETAAEHYDTRPRSRGAGRAQTMSLWQQGPIPDGEARRSPAGTHRPIGMNFSR